MTEQLLVLQKGTVVNYNGFPFALANDTEVLGTPDNLRLAQEE